MKNEKVTLSLLAQQYGLTVEDLMARGHSREDIIVEGVTNPNEADVSSNPHPTASEGSDPEPTQGARA